MPEWDNDAIAAKWQAAWWEQRLHHAEAGDRSKPTYFLHFAYPGISGYLHVGHMRGFTYADVLTRFKRQTGYNVLFPAGFHASGIPAVAFAKEVERGEKTDYLLANGYDEGRDGPIARLKDPQAVVDYFAHVYTHDYWKRFGFLIDDRRNATTIDPGYQAFIQWQFRRLNDHGWLIQKPHYAPFCPVAGPVAVDKSETDIKSGGAAEINEFIALRFTAMLTDGTPVILPCATLRPETIYGVTNLWAHPDHDYELVRVWRDGAVADDDPSELWVVSQQGRIKLEWQMERAEATGTVVNGKQLLDLVATAPVTGHQVRVVQGTFVDPMIATGIVMSVPAHAPFDYAAYRDAGLLEELGTPPQIISIEGYDDLPARVACDQHGVKSQGDREALEAATDQIYRDEFNKGIFNDACGNLAGERVKAAKDDLRTRFIDADDGRIIRQFSEPVVSRAGEVVDVRRIPDQDFIHYADEEWTARAKEHAASMTIQPQRYADTIADTLDWFGDRACVRRGAWLGTPFPFKPDWIIEPIADSTFYPWYYLVSLYVAKGDLAPEDLTDAFFDYVFNGRGAAADGSPPASAGAKADVWEAVRADVQYWGPVDINLGGKEHQTVHFPVYIMNMVGLMDDPAQWPRGIFVNWWVTQQAGAKISKSKGGAEPIPGAIAAYGIDAMRLYYCHVGSPHVDIEWDPDVVRGYRDAVGRIQRMVDHVLAADGEASQMDAWLEAAMGSAIGNARDALESMDLRTATTELVYTIPDLLRWYERRGGNNGALLAQLVQSWAAALCPVLPHTAEEMWARAGGQGLCATADYPTLKEPDGAAAVLAREEYLKAFLDDAKTVVKLADLEQPSELMVFTTSEWKAELLRRAVTLDG